MTPHHTKRWFVIVFSLFRSSPLVFSFYIIYRHLLRPPDKQWPVQSFNLFVLRAGVKHWEACLCGTGQFGKIALQITDVLQLQAPTKGWFLGLRPKTLWMVLMGFQPIPLLLTRSLCKQGWEPRSKNYGSPNCRERCYIVGVRIDVGGLDALNAMIRFVKNDCVVIHDRASLFDCPLSAL